MNQGNLRVVFLLMSDTASTRLSIESICALPNITPVAALVDNNKLDWRYRWRMLKRKVRRSGWRFLVEHTIEFLRERTDGLLERLEPPKEQVRQLLRTAFPGRIFTVAELGEKYGFAIRQIGNINSPQSVEALREATADLGIVLGTRIVKEHVFTIPRMGCINLHKGKVPEYRGMPPGFWELYDGASAAGVTVHYVDKGLDTGDIVTSSEIPISPLDTPDSLKYKLDVEGSRLLAEAVRAIQASIAQRCKQPSSSHKPRTQPTPSQQRELLRRLPYWRFRVNREALVKNVYSLLVYYSGFYSLIRFIHRLRPRGCVLLYHRVNDFSKDVLTVNTETFAAQLIALARRYRPVSTRELVNRLRVKEKIPPATVAIHFDDCYRDIFLNGAPILKALGYTATAFVSSGFVDTDRIFDHDRRKYPFQFPNLQSADLQAWIQAGNEIGAHTVNHTDLGQCDLEAAHFEVLESGRQLRSMLNGSGGNHVPYFSFPFGTISNIRPEVVTIIQQAGYEALFSAHGGFVGAGTKLFDIPRVGSCGENGVLNLLLAMEGLTPAQVIEKIRSWL
jgi:peptidoglycan/xylan/chitin deacetylase (PgdA/CDA1 family)